ncbi:MAG: glycosyltransferase family 2 protein [Burkholderiales bacterium]
MHSLSPTVSVVMPCYNVAQFLLRSIGSLLAQTYSGWELIAIDDGSSDGTAATLRRMGHPRISVLEQRHAGASAARNRGIEVAKGKFLAFLDADDEWHPEFLERMTHALLADSNAILAYCGWQNVGLPGARGAPFIPQEHQGDERLRWLVGGCRWPIHAALTRTGAVRAAGGFPLGQTNAEDFSLWLRVATCGPIVRVPLVLAYYHFHDHPQASSNRAQASVQMWRTQCRFLEECPEIARTLGRRSARHLTYGQLADRGLEAHWRRDFETSRVIFAQLVAKRYLPPRTWSAVAALLMPSALRDWWLADDMRTPEP